MENGLVKFFITEKSFYFFKSLNNKTRENIQYDGGYRLTVNKCDGNGFRNSLLGISKPPFERYRPEHFVNFVVGLNKTRTSKI